jgi:hypothetical protein
VSAQIRSDLEHHPLAINVLARILLLLLAWQRRAHERIIDAFQRFS